MTLVIGAVNKTYVFLASDGYALFQEDHSLPTYKLDTYSKIKLFHNKKIALGFAGSHEVSIEFCDGFKSYFDKDEIFFLESLSNDLAVINKKDEYKKAAVIVGYHFCDVPRIVLLPHSGGYEIQHSVCAVGAGANVAIDYLSEHWMDELCIPEAIATLTECVYNSSIVPTVNFLPMIIILGKNVEMDLSADAINAFHDFKSDLKDRLVCKAKKLLG